MGSGRVLDAVAKENYGSYPPSPGANDTDGNASFMGFEVQYSGGHAPTKAQYNAMVKGAAAVCKHYGWSAKSVIGHKEWTSRKDDPGHVDMKVFRADVQKLINGATPAPAPAPKPTPTVRPKTPGQIIAQLRKRVANQKKKIARLIRRQRNS
jgi:hypothetical protein